MQKIDLNQYYNYAINLRRYLHEHPELSNKEKETSSYLKKEIAPLPLDIREVDDYSFIAILDTGRPGPTIGLRTDIDALPIDESSLNLKGQKVAISKNKNVMHACGHDGHMAILLTSMRHIIDRLDTICGKAIFIFEQAEEVGGGIHKMVDYLSDFNIDCIYGNHLYAELETGKIIVNSGPTMAGGGIIDVEVLGQGGHASRPNLSKNPIIASSHIISAWSSAWLNQINNEEIVTLGIGQLQSGSVYNIIPSSAHIEGTYRFFDLETGEQALEVIKNIATLTARTHQCEAKFNSKMDTLFPPVYNNPDLARYGQNIVKKYFGEAHLIKNKLWFASETFANYQKLCPCLFSLVGIKNEEKGTGAGHHNEYFDIDEQALPYAYGLMTYFTLEYLSRDKD